MANNKRPRKAYKPRTYNVCGITHVMSGLQKMTGERLVDLQARNHAAMFRMTQGMGDRDTWDRLVGAINMAVVMSEQGTGDEYRQTLLDAQAALLHVGKRALNSGKFGFTGDELTTMNEAMDVHDAQIEASRVIDIERAFDEVMRRLKGNINVQRIVEKEAA